MYLYLESRRTKTLSYCIMYCKALITTLKNSNTMKIEHNLIALLFAIALAACSTSKKTTNDQLFDKTWELEYLSGPRIAFEGLYPEKKPTITFSKASKRVAGNNSCNGYATNFTLDGKSISFGKPMATTMMYCGEGENFFLSTIEKVDNYHIDEEGKLNLNIAEVPMMRFKAVDKK